MIGIDTNVLVRLLIGDDADQHSLVRRFVAARTARDAIYVSAVVLAETVWLLRGRFGYSEESVLEALQMLTQSPEFQLEHGEPLRELLSASRKTTDIADHLIAWSGEAAGCARTVTFDVRAARLIPSMELLA